MRERSIDQVVDVGANVGDYGALVRHEGFTGAIHSFEPLAHPFERMTARSLGDPHWFCHQLALGEKAGRQQVNVSANVVSSSILELTDITLEHSDSVRYVGREEVTVTTLDEVGQRLGNGPTWLKLDVQGYELNVLRGGVRFLERVVGIDCEVSLVALYADQPLIEDIVAWLRPHGFVPTWIEPGVIHTGTGALLQADMTFERA